MKNEAEKEDAGAVASSVGLACPFCGRTTINVILCDASWRHNSTTVRRLVAHCEDCGAQGPAFGPMSMTNEWVAFMYWNHRQANK